MSDEHISEQESVQLKNLVEFIYEAYYHEPVEEETIKYKMFQTARSAYIMGKKAGKND